MNLREQEYICMIAKCRSITKAAKALNITQSALSLFVQNVEKRLDVKLFDRYKREVVPTYIGELYLESARKILKEGEGFQTHLRDYLDDGKGRIRFGINSKRSPLVVPNLLMKMRKHFPNVEIMVKESDTLQLTDMLANHELDCIYSYKEINEPGFLCEPLQHDHLGLIMSVENEKLAQAKYHPEWDMWHLDMELLEEETFLLYENDESREVFDQIVKDAKIQPKIQEYFNVETMLELAEMNYGILYMNEMYIHNFCKNRKEDPLRFCLTGNRKDRIDIYLSYREALKDQEWGKGFLDYIREVK